ncbi:MAG: UvrD-helicase domain-containing protein, partial [Acidobacteriaceae bacterium]
MVSISSAQQEIIHSSRDAKIFLEGKAGTGKTTAAVERMLHLMNTGIPGNTILVFVPQRTLAAPYYDVLNSPGVVAGGMPTILTIGGLAQRMVDLFWPAVARQVGFSKPDSPPIFLNLEVAQYFMARIVRPLLEEGLFSSVVIDRNRIFSQIIDNLNKAAVVGFPYQEIGQRLSSAWSGEPGQSRVYQDAQSCATQFRQFCLQHNLLDFSLQIEMFWNHLWKSSLCHDYLIRTYKHLIIDNAEEDVPITHDLLAEWIPIADSTLVVYDLDAGYRRFLGADPVGANVLREQCSQVVRLTQSFVTSPEIHALSAHLEQQ